MEYLENHCTISHDLNGLLVERLTSIDMPIFIQIAEEMMKLKFLMVFWRYHSINSSAIWMKIGMSIEVNLSTSNPFRSCEIVQWFSRYSILYSTCRGKITRTVNIGERHTSCHTALGH